MQQEHFPFSNFDVSPVKHGGHEEPLKCGLSANGALWDENFTTDRLPADAYCIVLKVKIITIHKTDAFRNGKRTLKIIFWILFSIHNNFDWLLNWSFKIYLTFYSFFISRPGKNWICRFFLNKQIVKKSIIHYLNYWFSTSAATLYIGKTWQTFLLSLSCYLPK